LLSHITSKKLNTFVKGVNKVPSLFFVLTDTTISGSVS